MKKRYRYDRRLKEKIISMLTENTGKNFLDSGEAYGRHFQRNRGTNFHKSPVTSHYGYEGDKNYYETTYNLFHFMKNFLEIDRKTGNIEKEFNSFCNKEENRQKHYMECMIEFIEDSEKYKSCSEVIYTYNEENILSQDIQYKLFTTNEEYNESDPWYSHDMYILLQVHGGCDARGGLSRPRVFRVRELDYFSMAMRQIDCVCEECKLHGRYGENSGWYSDNGGSSFSSHNDEIDLYFTINEDREPIHDLCGNKLEFYVMESF